MRTWGRINGQWVAVTTDANGYNDSVYATTLCQCLKLNLGEDPFNANYGIPAQQSVQQQLFPDYYAQTTQQQFAQYFSNLIISKVPNLGYPYYLVNATLHNGAKISQQVPI